MGRETLGYYGRQMGFLDRKEYARSDDAWRRAVRYVMEVLWKFYHATKQLEIALYKLCKNPVIVVVVVVFSSHATEVFPVVI